VRYPSEVEIIEVGLRDGIQSEPVLIPVEQKLALADAMTAAGVMAIEAASFAHPKAVPQMADAEAVMRGLRRKEGVRYAVLVPNRKGAERALATGADEIRCVVMASETFNLTNVRMATAQSLTQIAEIAAMCHAPTTPVRFVGAVGATFGCPFEGDVPSARILDLVGQLVAIGANAILLADTTGMANPLQVARLTSLVLSKWPDLEIILHLHNTRGTGLANLLGGLEAGITRFEASLGGLGGCPFAPRATGNICTEDAVHMLHEMGIQTGIDLERLIEASMLMEQIVGRELPGQVMKAGPRNRCAVG
jgi:hydroxymethylglutaryl-CoA lyase